MTIIIAANNSMNIIMIIMIMIKMVKITRRGERSVCWQLVAGNGCHPSCQA